MSLADDARWCADNLDHSLTLTKADNAMALLRSCADKLDRLTAELASEKRVSDAGKAFRDLVVKERDYARIKNDRLTAELAAAKRDAERLDFLDRASHRCFGWRVLVAPAGNVSVQSVIFLGEGNPPVSIRAAIDAAIAAQEPK